jgi:glycosyltransferase involved in cell wall biosynthesis
VHQNSPVQLSIVVPVSLMHGKLQNLESWLKYTPDNFEVLLVHDIRDLETGPELEKLVNVIGKPNIKLLQKAYGSTGSARNTGANGASKEWIAFWDSDDLPKIDEFIGMVEETSKNNCEIGVGSFEVIDDRSLKQLAIHILGSNFNKNIEMICKNPGIWRFVFKREILTNISYPPLRIGEEQVFLEKLDLINRNIHFSQNVVYQYLKGSSFHTSSKKKAIEDVVIAAGISWKLLRSDSSNNQGYKMNFFLRQVISAIKNGNFRTKVLGIYIFVTRFFWSNFRTKKLIFVNLKRIINF